MQTEPGRDINLGTWFILLDAVYHGCQISANTLGKNCALNIIVYDLD